jgi:hypothetical protein
MHEPNQPPTPSEQNQVPTADGAAPLDSAESLSTAQHEKQQEDYL